MWAHGQATRRHTVQIWVETQSHKDTSDGLDWKGGGGKQTAKFDKCNVKGCWQTAERGMVASMAKDRDHDTRGLAGTLGELVGASQWTKTGKNCHRMWTTGRALGTLASSKKKRARTTKAVTAPSWACRWRLGAFADKAMPLRSIIRQILPHEPNFPNDQNPGGVRKNTVLKVKNAKPTQTEVGNGGKTPFTSLTSTWAGIWALWAAL